jgi:ASC-1-like (ASCH) protein
MGNRILKFRVVDREIFDAIIDGSKKIETRAATPKYRKVRVGDVLTLVCGKKKIKKRVREVGYFKTTSSVLKKYKVEDINPKISSIKEAKEMWHSFPGYKEKIKKFGLVAWRLK